MCFGHVHWGWETWWTRFPTLLFCEFSFSIVPVFHIFLRWTLLATHPSLRDTHCNGISLEFHQGYCLFRFLQQLYIRAMVLLSWRSIMWIYCLTGGLKCVGSLTSIGEGYNHQPTVNTTFCCWPLFSHKLLVQCSAIECK